VSDFDVLVLGSGPGGQKAAIAAAKLERRVAIVERRNMIGGVLSLVRACCNRAVGRIAGKPVDGFVGWEACTDVRL
jgi:pyruvate/2-oxoglutarate dehydrogenase complex dihydrolipoamide dehydrogenase (E3) component